MLHDPSVTRNRRTSFPGGVPSFGEGRVCADGGCDTRLSRYNDATTCAAHGDGGRRGRR